jgi:hypothetical protein
MESGQIVGKNRMLITLITTACAPATRARATSLASLVAIPAEDGTVAARFEGHGGWLTAAGTDHRCTLRRSRTVATTATRTLIVFLCHPARFAPLWGRVAALLEKRLIRSGEGKVLPTIAASELNIAGHGSPRAECTANCTIFDRRIE